jgi:putative oxidoreductase
MEMTMVGMPQSTALMTRPAEVQPAEAHDGQGMPPSRRPGAALVDRAVEVNQQIAPTLLRLSLATVFVWFGALKLVGSSPVHELIAATLPFVDADISVPVLGVVEIVLGLALASGIFPRITLLVLSGHLAGTFLTFVTASELMWTGNLLNLTADGEFVVKNLVLITSALVLIGHYSRQAQVRRTA